MEENDIVKRLRNNPRAFTDIEVFEAADEIERLRAELAAERRQNELLRASLANSELPCVYCSLPKEKWAECKNGFPGCGRADDAMGCPELGASLERDALREALDRIQDAILDHLEDDRTPGREALVIWRGAALAALKGGDRE